MANLVVRLGELSFRGRCIQDAVLLRVENISIIFKQTISPFGAEHRGVLVS